MTWHTATVPVDALTSLLARIRDAGGTVACSRPGDEGVRVTWTTVEAASVPESSHGVGRP